MNKVEHEDIVLAGIIGGDPSRLLGVQQRLALEHLSEDHGALLLVLGEYLHEYGDVVSDVDLMADLLAREGADAATVMRRVELFESVQGTPVEDHRFDHSLDVLIDHQAAKQTADALDRALQIAAAPAVVVDGVRQSPHESARRSATQAIAAIDRLADPLSVPDDPLDMSIGEFRRHYGETKHAPDGGAIFTGIGSLDEPTGGLHGGELVLIAGATAAGKSQVVNQLGWHAAIRQGKVVVLVTLENSRQQVMNRIIARHSKELFPSEDPLNSKHLRDGTLTENQEKMMDAVLDDLDSGFADGRHGRLYVIQLFGSTMDQLMAQLLWRERRHPIDLVIIDFLPLLRPGRARGVRWEEKADLLVEAKQMSMAFRGGLGAPVVTPWPVNREGHKAALATGAYELSALAESVEAERCADKVFSLLHLPNTNEINLDVLKNRDGPAPKGIRLDFDLQCGWFADRAVNLGSPWNDDEDFLDL